MEENPQQSLIELNVDYDAGNILREITRWTKFIAITGIIGVACLMLILLFGGNRVITSISDRYMSGSENFRGLILFAIVIIIAVLGLIVFLLYRFSTLIKRGIEMQDQESFNKGLNSLKIYFIISGILALITVLSNLTGLLKF
ncbi:MAG TPA: hypothetical protein VHZ50_05130 [Puia sp.]|jgi:hypothetical protein|nr:hypothetical protein [Puia sp.]